jgi:sugar phosphate isomerase/epimerase
MRSAVTLTLLPEAKAGPFVFADLQDGCRVARDLGFDGLEIFPPSGEAVREATPVLREYGLSLAAVGTGGGAVRHKLSLTHPDLDHRQRARQFVQSLIDAAAESGASAIVGSMQGRWGEALDRDATLRLLADALNGLGEHALSRGVPLLYEPLNRYETNLVNSLADAARFVDQLTTRNVRILLDLFHANIEEANMSQSIRSHGRRIGHVHWADSNRRAAGLGHTDFAPVAAALREVGYEGYVSAEVLPLPDPQSAARQTIESFRKHFPR